MTVYPFVISATRRENLAFNQKKNNQNPVTDWLVLYVVTEREKSPWPDF